MSAKDYRNRRIDLCTIDHSWMGKDKNGRDAKERSEERIFYEERRKWCSGDGGRPLEDTMETILRLVSGIQIKVEQGSLDIGKEEEYVKFSFVIAAFFQTWKTLSK